MTRCFKPMSGVVIAWLMVGCTHIPPLPDSQHYHEVLYQCERGSAMVHFYLQQSRALLIRDNHTIELRQEPAASGFRYSNVKVTIRGKGDRMSLEIGRMMPIACEAE
ncbi:MliC family protein [Amphritea sp. 1_MG-2023]|uniref:MliC family protein n=1 Tax=Amphritea sp. 1_MG-2023 TaxID=3062670 RepID=UPI0026E39DB7|nr:MliC family protein [Amphritea sp. 1_MG-2023]MDO6562132.1 MliC family protein [Amphritea sp. 1_MG-2023]